MIPPDIPLGYGSFSLGQKTIWLESASVGSAAPLYFLPIYCVEQVAIAHTVSFLDEHL